MQQKSIPNLEVIDEVIKQIEFLTQHAEDFKYSVETTLAWQNLQMATKWLNAHRNATIEKHKTDLKPFMLFQNQHLSFDEQWSEFWKLGGNETFFITKIAEIVKILNETFVPLPNVTRNLNEAKFWYEISEQLKKEKDEREFDDSE